MQRSGKCPKCQSLKIVRYTSNYMCDSGLVRYLCTECGLRESHVADVKALMDDDVVSWQWLRPDDGPFR